MKNLLLFFVCMVFFSCKKDPEYGPLKLKDGQEVELLVDHRYGAVDDILLKLPEKTPAEAYLSGFEQREPGYTYKVKAKFKYNQNPPADGSSYSFEFVEVISKDQYKGTDPFEIRLITSYIPGGPSISLGKTGDDYYYIPEKLQLTYTDSAIQKQLEEIWQNAQEVRANWQLGQKPKWQAIKATVSHDPQKFGKAYLVQQIIFTP